MTCRHGPDDPNCSSYRTPAQRLEDIEKHREALMRQYNLPDTPDSDRFTIEDFEQVGNYLVTKVSYPNCAKCSYEGAKVMVFEGVTIKDAIRWKKIDPHFRENLELLAPPSVAPGPIARFPASEEGWEDAIRYARGKLSK